MRTIRGILITPGEAREHTIQTDDMVTAIQQTVDCDCFTVVGLDDGIDAFVDDEGLINHSELNLPLTIIAHRLGAKTVLFGNGFLAGMDQDGETISLTDAQRTRISEALSTKPDEDTLEALADSFAPFPSLVARLRAVR